MSTAAPPLGKHLASSDKKTRDKAMKGLTAFLCDEANGKLSKADMVKLWKGIFYCFWMSDKPLVQQALATDLANILLSIPNIDSSLQFLRGFWEALVREWSGLDRLRLDKYYMLVRRYVNASFRLLMRSGWSGPACATYNDILSGPGGPLYPNDSRIPSSLSYHLADVYLDELNKALSSFPEDAVPVPLIDMISPFLRLAAETSSNITFTRLQSALLDPLLSSLKISSTSVARNAEPARKRPRLEETSSSELSATQEDVETFESPYHTIAHRSRVVLEKFSTDSPAEQPSSPGNTYKAVLRHVFQVASQESTRDTNRRKMYAIWKAAKEDLDDEED